MRTTRAYRINFAHQVRKWGPAEESVDALREVLCDQHATAGAHDRRTLAIVGHLGNALGRAGQVHDAVATLE